MTRGWPSWACPGKQPGGGAWIRALELQNSIRVLDGLYVALAERQNCPLVTTDARLARADLPCQVIGVSPSDAHQP